MQNEAITVSKFFFEDGVGIDRRSVSSDLDILERKLISVKSPR